MARPKKYVGTLSEEESEILEKIASSCTEEQRKVQRAKIVLMAASGCKNTDIAEQLKVSIPTICKVVKKWSLFGVRAALEDLSRSGRPPVIDLAARTWVVQLACHRPQDYPEGPNLQLWTISNLTRYIHQHCEQEGHPSLTTVQESTVWVILNETGIQPHRMKYYLVRKDPQFTEKAKEVLLLYKRVAWILQMTREEVIKGKSAPELAGDFIVAYDENLGVQAVGSAQDLRPTKQVGQGTVGRDCEHKRYGTVSLLSGIDLLTGEVTGLVRESHSSKEFIEFLAMLDEKYDKDLTIKILLDNHSVHKSKDVMEWLAQRPNRFSFTFTPTYASWLNLIDNFFGKLAKQCLKHLRVRSKEDLVKHIEDWMKETNETPVIHRWKWKPDDIEGAFQEAPTY